MRRGSIISRLTGAGAAAALLAFLLWPLSSSYDTLIWPYFGLVVVAALAGLVILLLTGADFLFHPRRGQRVGPIRVFDVVMGAGLLAFALIQLDWLAGRLPA